MFKRGTEITFYEISRNTFPTWRKNDSFLAYNYPLPDWVFTTEENICEIEETMHRLQRFFINVPTVSVLKIIKQAKTFLFRNILHGIIVRNLVRAWLWKLG